MTYYLRFSSKENFQAAAITAGLYTPPVYQEEFTENQEEPMMVEKEPGYYDLASHEHAMDIIGTIIKGGKWNYETGEELEPPTVLDGWHVNYIGTLPDGWNQYLVSPENPVRKFAGVD